MTNRPSRAAPAPAPSPSNTYCLDCGRVMPAAQSEPTSTPRKYCSASCRSRSKDRSKISDRSLLVHTFRRLLDDPTSVQPEVARGKSKGRDRAVLCSEAEKEAGIEGQDAREEARRAARRLVNFGWHSQGLIGDEDKAVEAVQEGKVVEASFAKGEWGIRYVT